MQFEMEKGVKKGSNKMPAFLKHLLLGCMHCVWTHYSLCSEFAAGARLTGALCIRELLQRTASAAFFSSAVS